MSSAEGEHSQALFRGIAAQYVNAMAHRAARCLVGRADFKAAFVFLEEDVVSTNRCEKRPSYQGPSRFPMHQIIWDKDALRDLSRDFTPASGFLAAVFVIPEAAASLPTSAKPDGPYKPPTFIAILRLDRDTPEVLGVSGVSHGLLGYSQVSSLGLSLIDMVSSWSHSARARHLESCLLGHGPIEVLEVCSVPENRTAFGVVTWEDIVLSNHLLVRWDVDPIPGSAAFLGSLWEHHKMVEFWSQAIRYQTRVFGWGKR